MSNSITASVVHSDALSQIGTVQGAAQQYASNVLGFTTDSLKIQDFWVSTPWVDPDVAASLVTSVVSSEPESITLNDIVATTPNAPLATSITIPEFGNIPELLAVAPTLTMPTPPTRNLPSAPGAAPEFNVPSIPSAPSLSLPDVPTFENVAIPAAPSYTLPTYTPSIPDDDLLAPTSSFVFSEEDYASLMLDSLKSKLINDLINGGYGIDPNDEQGLWERAREREVLAGEAMIQDAMRQQAARGFALPPGAAMALVEAAQQAALEKVSSINRDIALKRADLYVQNRQFTIQQVKDVEQMLITYFGYRMERALNVAKYTAEFGINVFNAMVSRYNARMEGARLAATVYETQLKAALSNLEAYKVQIEGARLTTEVQKLHTDVYVAQLEGVQAYVNIYRTQMEAANIQAEVEKTKLEAFRSTVDAYTAQVGARTAEFQMYEAQLKGEMTKVEVFKANVDAYGAQVNAFATKAQALKTTVDAQVNVAELKVDTYKAQLQAYGEELQKSQIMLQAQLGKYEADLRRYSVVVDAAKTAALTSIEGQKANASVAVQAAAVSSAHITQSANVLSRHEGLKAEASMGMFQVYGKQVEALAQMSGAIVAEIQSA